jgi:hypothetical protein
MPKAVYLNTGDDGPDDVLESEQNVDDWLDAGAPSLGQLWAEKSGEPAPPSQDWLSIKSAAARAGVSEKTIRRRLPDLEALDPAGAWRIGRVWRIRPDALDALKAVRAAQVTAAGRKLRKTPGNSPRWTA